METIVNQYDPVLEGSLEDGVEAIMEENSNGEYVEFYDYEILQEKYNELQEIVDSMDLSEDIQMELVKLFKNVNEYICLDDKAQNLHEALYKL